MSLFQLYLAVVLGGATLRAVDMAINAYLSRRALKELAALRASERKLRDEWIASMGASRAERAN